MKLVYAVATALLLAWAVRIRAETEDAVKLEQKQDDSTDVSPQSKSSEETEEEIVSEDLETIIEHLREINALRDTIRSLLPPIDSYMAEKLAKQQKIQSGDEEENSNGKETKESWMKTVMVKAKDAENLEPSQQISLSDIEEDWSEAKTEEEIPEEEPAPLTPQEQEGDCSFNS